MKKHNIIKPKTIQEAIENLLVFLECDLWTKLNPRETINGEVYYREDTIDSEQELIDYLREIFKILQDEVKELQKGGKNG